MKGNKDAGQEVRCMWCADNKNEPFSIFEFGAKWHFWVVFTSDYRSCIWLSSVRNHKSYKSVHEALGPIRGTVRSRSHSKWREKIRNDTATSWLYRRGQDQSCFYTVRPNGNRVVQSLPITFGSHSQIESTMCEQNCAIKRNTARDFRLVRWLSATPT